MRPWPPGSQQVKFADGEEVKFETRLFVGQIGAQTSADHLRAVFGGYGPVEAVDVITKGGASQGCAFVRFQHRAHAAAAIEALHGNFVVDGCDRPLVVRFAEPERVKLRRRVQQQLQLQLQQVSALTAAVTATHSAAPPGAGDAGAEAGGAASEAAEAAGAADARGPRAAAKGPAGCNVFVLHLPREWDERALAEAFRPFGRVLSCTVFRDRATRLSRCFGFVSYGSPEAAALAVANLDNMQVGRHRLKVSLKEKGRGAAPY